MFLKPPPELVAARGARLSAASWLLIALALLAPFALYLGTAKSIVAIWNSSETFAHGYVIVPISLWLVWRRRENFRAMPPAPYWPALALLALCGAGWLLARLGEVQVVQQYGFVAMLPLIALAVLGPRLAWSLAFPLLFLLFAVPFGEVFIEPLIAFTADFTVWALQATGIPVLRSGTHFEIPSGSWSVVEACSGVRYLISSVTIGCLYAYLTYRSTARRTLFIAVSVVVPILANGARAYMIVMIGHLSGMKLAVGVDHLIYGWLFFGLVMFVMFWIGSYWREDGEMPASAAMPDRAASSALPAPTPPARLAPIVLAVIALSALWPAFAIYNDRANFNPKPVQLAAIPVGWQEAPAFAEWTPDYMEPDAGFSGVFRAGEGQPVALKVLYYRNQDSHKALISSINYLAGEKNAFHVIRSGVRSETFGGRTLALREAALQGPGGQILVWHWTWIDGQATTNNYLGKLWQARAKLMFRGDDGAAVMLSASYGEHPDEARAALRAFLEANLAAIENSLAAAREH